MVGLATNCRSDSLTDNCRKEKGGEKKPKLLQRRTKLMVTKLNHLNTESTETKRLLRGEHEEVTEHNVEENRRKSEQKIEGKLIKTKRNKTYVKINEVMRLY